MCFQCLGGFVVKFLELRFKAAGAEKSVGALVGSEDGGTFLVRHGFNVDEVAVVVVEDEHVAVAARGGVEEASGKVGEDLAGDACKVDVEVIGPECCGGGGGGVIVKEFVVVDR